MTPQAFSHESLTDSEKIFIDQYLTNGHNATRAYLSVNPSISDASAGVQGHKWLKRAKIAAALSQKRQELAHTHEIKREEIVSTLKHIITICTSGTASKSDFRYALQALEMLNKMGGQYIHRVDVTTHVEQPLFGDSRADYIIINPEPTPTEDDFSDVLD